MAEVTPQYGGISYERLEAEGGLQWPCPDDSHPGTPILHADRFTRGKGAFAAVDYTPPAERHRRAMPFVMSHRPTPVELPHQHDDRPLPRPR